MICALNYILGGFMMPVQIGTNPYSLLLALPLIAVIAVAYKATKIEEIKLWNFIGQCLILFGSIVVFMAVIAVCLYVVVRFTVG